MRQRKKLFVTSSIGDDGITLFRDGSAAKAVMICRDEAVEVITALVNLLEKSEPS